MSDRLALAHAFEDAGIPREKAENVATVVLDAIHHNVATKSDLVALEQRLKIWVGSVLVVLFTAQVALAGIALRYIHGG